MTLDSKKEIFLAVILAALTFAVYHRILGHSLLLNWDDYDYVVRNEMIREISWTNIKRAFGESYFYNYSPLHMISYMLDYALFGGVKPAGFFLVNLLLHAANGLLLFFLLLRVTGRTWLCFVAAFIFLLHPVQVESVAWLSQRKNVLSMFFFLLSFLGYVLCTGKGTRGRTLLFYCVSLFAFALALLAKSAAVVLPLFLLLYDLCYLSREERGRWLLNKVPYFGAAALMALATVRAQSSLVEAGRETFHTGGPLHTFYTMLTVLPRYLELLFLPTGLSAMYMPPVRFKFDGAVAFSGLVVLLLIALGVLLYRRNRRLFFWYAISFVALLPVLHIVPLPTLMNDRYLYYALVGGSVCLASLLVWLASLAGSDRRMLPAAVIGVILASLPLLSWQRVSVWRDDATLWRDVTVKQPRMPLAWASLGMSLYDAGRLEEAAAAYLQALAIDPNYQLALNNLGGLYNEMGESDKARPYLERTVQLFPEDFKGYMNLAYNLYSSGDLPRAEAMFVRALELNPDLPDAHHALGDLNVAMGKLGPARGWYRKAAAMVGTDAELEYKLARLEAIGGAPEKALKHLRAALAAGLNDARSALADPALDSLRTHPEFRLLSEQQR